MREQSGRSLIEIIGVLAISGIMVSAVFSMYQSISNRQKRMIASENLKEVATKTKTLLEYSGYQPVSVDFLVESGALNNTKAPIGSEDWSVTSSIGAKNNGFSPKSKVPIFISWVICFAKLLVLFQPAKLCVFQSALNS